MAFGCSDSGPPADAPRIGRISPPADMPTLKTRLDTLRAVREQGTPEEHLRVYQQGIDRLRESGIAGRALNVGDKAPDFTLTSATGESVTLAELLKQGPVVITWYHGSWSPYCNLELQALQEILPEIRRLGANLIAISPETSEYGVRTMQRIKLEFDLLTDRGNQAARTYKIVYKLSDEEIAFYQGRINLNKHNSDSSHELPLPVTYIVDSSGVIQYASIDPDYRNRTEPADLVSALERVIGN